MPCMPFRGGELDPSSSVNSEERVEHQLGTNCCPKRNGRTEGVSEAPELEGRC